jgi:hypothetical protein
MNPHLTVPALLMDFVECVATPLLAWAHREDEAAGEQFSDWTASGITLSAGGRHPGALQSRQTLFSNFQLTRCIIAGVASMCGQAPFDALRGVVLREQDRAPA